MIGCRPSLALVRPVRTAARLRPLPGDPHASVPASPSPPSPFHRGWRSRPAPRAEPPPVSISSISSIPPRKVDGERRGFLSNLARVLLLSAGLTAAGPEGLGAGTRTRGGPGARRLFRAEAAEAAVGMRAFKGKSGVLEFDVPAEGKYTTLYDRKLKPEAPGALVFLNEDEKIIIGKWRQLDPGAQERIQNSLANSDAKSAALELAPILHGSDEEATAAFAIETSSPIPSGLRYTFTKSVCNGVVKPDTNEPGELLCTGLGDVPRPMATRRYVCTTYLSDGGRVFALEASTALDRWVNESNELVSIAESLRLRRE